MRSEKTILQELFVPKDYAQIHKALYDFIIEAYDNDIIITRSVGLQVHGNRMYICVDSNVKEVITAEELEKQYNAFLDGTHEKCPKNTVVVEEEYEDEDGIYHDRIIETVLEPIEELNEEEIFDHLCKSCLGQILSVPFTLKKLRVLKSTRNWARHFVKLSEDYGVIV